MKVAIVSSASFQKINFAKLIPDNTTGIFSAVPAHLMESIVQYADVNRICCESRDLENSADKAREIERFCKECDHMIILWDGRPDIAKEVMEYAEKIKKPVSFFELDSMLYTEQLDDFGRLTLPAAIRQRLDYPQAFSVQADGSRMILRPVGHQCVFCEKGEPLRHMVLHQKSICICESCLGAIREISPNV